MKIGHAIDENGFWTGDVLEGSGITPNVTAICPDGFYKPKWDGSAWLEGKPQAEIDAEKNAPKPLSERQEIEQLKQQLAEINDIMIANMEGA